MPIKPHSTYIYKFPVIQNGTYWYHSHTKLQEQSGMHGALIFNKVNESKMPAIPVVLSDWTDMNPHEVERFLHTANDWFAIRKGTTQSYAEAIGKGYFNVKVTVKMSGLSMKTENQHSHGHATNEHHNPAPHNQAVEVNPPHHADNGDKYYCHMHSEGDKTYDKPGNCPEWIY